MNIPVTQIMPQAKEVKTGTTENQASNEENGALFSELMGSGLELATGQEVEETKEGAELSELGLAELGLASLMGQPLVLTPTTEQQTEEQVITEEPLTIEAQQEVEEISNSSIYQTQSLKGEWEIQGKSNNEEVKLENYPLDTLEPETEELNLSQLQQFFNPTVKKESAKWTDSPKLTLEGQLAIDSEESGLETITELSVSEGTTENPYSLLKAPSTRVIEAVIFEAEGQTGTGTQEQVLIEAVKTEEASDALGDLKNSNITEGFSRVMSQSTTTKEVAPQTSTVTWENKAEFEELMIKETSMLKEGESTNLVIKLKPYTLGEMQISLEMKNGQLRGLIELENAEAKKVVEENLKMLQGELKNSIIEVEQMSPQLRDERGFEGNSQKEQRFKEEGRQKQGNEQESFKELLSESHETAVELVV